MTKDSALKRWPAVAAMKQLAADYGLSDEQLDTICLTVAGDPVCNVSTAGAVLTTQAMQVKGKERTHEWVKELTRGQKNGEP